MEILDSLVLVVEVSSNAFLYGFLVGPMSKKHFWSMEFILALRNYSLLAHHIITLITFILAGFLSLLIAY